MYEDVEYKDLVQIFAESVIRWNKTPVYVKAVNRLNELVLQELGNKKEIITKVSDELLDFTPVPLGMCNEGKDAFYLTRIPYRQYKQGVCKQSLRIKFISKNYDELAADKLLTMKSQGLKECINGDYPTLQNAIEKIRGDEGVKAIAFSRQFALDGDFNIFFKTERVGIYDADANQFVLSRKNTYLEGLLNAR